MKRVDDHAAPLLRSGGVERQRGEAAEGARFRSMRMYDVRLFAKDDPRELQKRAHVAEWADAASQLGDLESTKAAGVGQVLEARFAVIDGTVDEEGVVSARVESAIEQHDMARRSSDVEAGDDADDLQAIDR